MNEDIDLTVHDFSADATAHFYAPDEQSPQLDLKTTQSYEKVQKLGEGAMGEVHLVRDALLRRKVAYKQLLDQKTDDPNVALRFVNEAQITAQLEHPYIVPVYSFEQTDSGVGYTMKRIQGLTFKDIIQDAKKGKGLSLRERLGLFLKACSAMSFAHDKGIIHRDLKPANVMVGDFNEVYILDWGIARPFGSVAKNYRFEAEETNKVIGTPRYLSPEQARAMNARLDQRSDIFALGLILFELVCLEPAYKAKSQNALYEKVLMVELEPFAEDTPRELKAILTKVLDIKRDKRYQRADELAEDIERYLQDQAVLAEADTRTQAAVRWFRHHRTFSYGLILSFLLVSALVSLFQLYQRQQALLVSRQEQKALSNLILGVSAQGKVLDQTLLSTKKVLMHLQGAAIQNLKHGQITDQPYYLDDIHFNANTPDLTPSSHYGQPISLDWTASTIAYTVPESKVKQQLQQMSPLRHVFKNLLFDYVPKEVQDPKAYIREKGVLLHFAHITTKEGVIQYYPGTSYLTPNYDPRKRPFYTLVDGKRGIHCGNPILDKVGGKLLACSLGIYDASDTFLGVAAIDLQFNFIARHYLSLTYPGVRESYLLDKSGQQVIKASDQHDEVKRQNKVHQGYQLKAFKNAELLDQLKAGKSRGYLTQGETTYVYLRLNFLDWIYVVEADTKVVLSAANAQELE